MTGDVTLFGDRPRLVEIWQNLVENAVKFMGEQPAPRLEIGLERQGVDTGLFCLRQRHRDRSPIPGENIRYI